MYRLRTKKTAALAVVIMILLCLCAPAAADSLKSAPLTSGNTMKGMVRVRLSSLGRPSALKLTVSGSYTVNGQSTQTLTSGSTVTVHFSGSRLSLTANGKTIDMGTVFKLRRHETSGQNGIRIAQSRVPGNLYPGDFTFTVQGSTLYIVASIYMEDYLYGVLPYEMGDSSGIEALKAQAVAARTYTMRCMQARSGNLYDVVDTTSDQVYNGTPSGCANCKKAVDATKGIVAKNGSSLTATYYTASNGGQTESIKNAWGTTGYSYLTVKNDPYDLINPASPKRTFRVNAGGSQTNTTLNSLLSKKAATVFGSGAVITAVTDVTTHSPKYASPSSLNTKLTFDVDYTLQGKKRSGSLTFDIFSELEGPLGMSINTLKNELWTVEKTDTGFTVSARRYGHGIGMSQRGAMQMAQMGFTYDQILAFYFEGCTRVQYTLNRSILSAVVPGQPSQEQVISETPAAIEYTPTATPAPTPSPAPTASPTPIPRPAEGNLSARVDTGKGSLNLRKAADSGARVLCRIPKDAWISVLEKGGAWCKVTFDGKTGYVQTQFLAFPEAGKAESTAQPTATAASSSAEAYARVDTPQGSLNLRKIAQENAQILCTVPKGAGVAVIKKNAKWTKVTYQGKTGYVMTKYLAFSDTPIAPQPTATAAVKQALYAQVTTQNGGCLYLRRIAQDTSQVLAEIPCHSSVAVVRKNVKWTKVTYQGKTGYVMTKFLTFSDTPFPAEQISATAAPKSTSTPKSAVTAARVSTKNGGSLYLRKTKNDSSQILASIPNQTLLTVTVKGSVWCKVTYNGKTGYVMTRHLSFSGTAAAAQQSAKQAPEELRPLKIAVPGRITSKNGNKLNLRTECSTDAVVLYQMPDKAYLTVTAVGKTWCAVEYEGKTGYCMREYLEFTLNE